MSVFERDTPPFANCSYVAAGLLDSIGALDDAEPLISELASESVPLWPEILQSLDAPVLFGQRGTLALVHPNDREQLDHWLQRIRRLNPHAPIEVLRGSELRELEPEIDPRFEEALFFPQEGHIDNRALIPALHSTLQGQGVCFHFGTEITDLNASELRTATATHRFDQVVDCRGLRAAVPGLRGVRGELLVVRAPDVTLTRPVRLLHPKHAVYVVPRPRDQYAIGATQIECEDYRNVTVRSALELLSAAYVVHSGFGEAEIIETLSQCRPAFSDNMPNVTFKDGILHVNGMFRHGYLISPKVTALACEYLETGNFSSEAGWLGKEEPQCASF